MELISIELLVQKIVLNLLGACAYLLKLQQKCWVKSFESTDEPMLVGH
jgi:hypothetical protein